MFRMCSINGGIISEKWIGSNLEGIDRAAIWGNIPAYYRSSKETHEQNGDDGVLTGRDVIIN
jgi:hypothetical protein